MLVCEQDGTLRRRRNGALHNRRSRFTAGEINAVPGSEVVLLDLPTLGVSGWHRGGSLGGSVASRVALGHGGAAPTPKKVGSFF